MREKGKTGKFKKEKKRNSVALKKEDMKWLKKHTNFDPDAIELWHKVFT